jgi:hypothetical protein
MLGGFPVYVDSLFCKQQGDDLHGKKKVDLGCTTTFSIQELWPHRKAQIEPPPEGFTEVNTDASFIFESGVASAGVVAFDHLRSVIFSIGLKKQKLRLYYRVCISA